MMCKLTIFFTGDSKLVQMVATVDIEASPDDPVELWCAYGSKYWHNGKQLILDVV